MNRRALALIALAGIAALVAFVPSARTKTLGTQYKDVRAIGLEVTQDVQTIKCADPTSPCSDTLPTYGSHHHAIYSGVKLVAHKKTVVRLYADAISSHRSDAFVGAYLYGTRNGSPLPGSPLGSRTSGKFLPTGPAAVGDDMRGDPTAGFVFDLPSSWTSGTIELTAQLEPLTELIPPYGAECSGCGANNSFDLTGVKFEDTGYISVLPVDLKTRGFPAAPSPSKVLSETGTLVPLGDGGFEVGSHYELSVDVTDIAKANTWGDIDLVCNYLPLPFCSQPLGSTTKEIVTEKDTLIADELQDAVTPYDALKRIGFPIYDVAIGVNTSVNQGLDRGSINKPSLPVDVVEAGPGYNTRDLPHEVGHAFGRMHAGDMCGASNPEPWPPDHKGELDSVGLDPRSNSGVAFGGVYRPLLGRTLSGQGSSSKSSPKYNPGTWFDLMSYCSPLTGVGYWISAKGWDEEVDNLRTYGKAHGRVTSAAREPVAGLRVDALLLPSGEIIPTGVAPALLPRGGAGDSSFSAVVRSRTGAALAHATMTATAAHADPSGTAVIFLEGDIPFPPVARAKGGIPEQVGMLQILDGGKPAVTIRRNPSAPVVRLLAPASGTKIGGRGSVTVRWRATEKGSKRLRARIDYSDDGGRTFRPVWGGPSNGVAVVPANEFPAAKTGVLRLAVSDGFDQTLAQVGQLAVAGASPDVEIADPAPRTSIDADQPLSLAAQAVDDRGVTIPAESLAWLVDGRQVAQGRSADVEGLTPGRHIVALRATDHLGRVGTAKTLVVVVPVTPRLLPLQTRLVAPPTARVVTLELATTVPADAVVSGAGVHRTAVRLGRQPQRVEVPVAPGRAALTLRVRLSADGRSSSVLLDVPR